MSKQFKLLMIWFTLHKIFTISNRCDVITINCNQIVEMLANNIVSPFSCEKRNFVFQFSFHYATSKDCFHRLDQLHRASTLPPKEHQEMIEAIVYSRHSRVNFDPCWLEDPHESILFEARVTQVQQFGSKNYILIELLLIYLSFEILFLSRCHLWCPTLEELFYHQLDYIISHTIVSLGLCWKFDWLILSKL